MGTIKNIYMQEETDNLQFYKQYSFSNFKAFIFIRYPFLPYVAIKSRCSRYLLQIGTVEIEAVNDYYFIF